MVVCGAADVVLCYSCCLVCSNCCNRRLFVAMSGRTRGSVTGVNSAAVAECLDFELTA